MFSKYHTLVFALVLYGILTMPPSPFLSQAYANSASLGKNYCKTKKTKEANDPCHEAELKEKAAESNYITAGVYGVATATCIAQCIYGAGGLSGELGPVKITPCSIATGAGTVSSIIGSIMVSEKGADIMSLVSGAAMPAVAFGGIMTAFDGKKTEWWGGGGGSKLEQAGYSKSELAKGDEKVIYKKDGQYFKERPEGEGVEREKVEYGKESDNTDDKGDTSACASALADAVFTGYNIYQAKQNKDAAEDAYKKKVDAVGKSEVLALNPSGNDQKKQDTTAPEQKDPTFNKGTNKEEEGKLTPDKLASSAIEAGFSEPLKDFQKLTGRPATELFDRMLNGENPAAFTTAMAGETLGGDVASAGAALAKVGEKAAELAREDLAKKGADSLAIKSPDSSFGGSTGKVAKGGGHSDPMAGLQDVLNSLIPKKPGEKDTAKNSANLALGSRNISSSKLTSDGLHQADKSIFDIVGNRYQTLSKDFLQSGKITHDNTPSQVVPKNLYLKN